jgi:HEPN domain-containing protein
MAERSKDWIKQAERDLASAKAQKKDGFFEWATFIAQQAAEKAVKSVYHKLGGEAWGHSVTELLKGLREKIDIEEELLNSARYLDKFYIPARYPNGWAEGAPFEYITEEDVENALHHSEKILQFCKSILAK